MLDALGRVLGVHDDEALLDARAQLVVGVVGDGERREHEREVAVGGAEEAEVVLDDAVAQLECLAPAQADGEGGVGDGLPERGEGTPEERLVSEGDGRAGGEG